MSIRKSRIVIASLAAASLVTVSACVTDPNTGQQKASRTAIGGVGGALAGLAIGSLIGGRTARLIGAGVGGAAGAVIGHNMDQQIRKLKEVTAGTGVDVSEADNGQSILLTLPDGVTFDTNSYTLKPQFRPTLDQVSASLKEFPDSLVDVYGHTDSTGSVATNQVLSENRAQTVANYFITQGVGAGRIKSQGFASTLPVADNTTPEGRARNRRVEIKIIPISQEQVQAAQREAY